MVSVLTSSAVDRRSIPGRVKPKTEIGICCSHIIKEKEQGLVGSESEKCVGVERYIYSRTVVSVS
jgi:hypothetical protein